MTKALRKQNKRRFSIKANQVNSAFTDAAVRKLT